MTLWLNLDWEIIICTLQLGGEQAQTESLKSQRLCNRCHNSVDDELHMVFECPVFECVRTHSYFTELFVNTAEHKDMESFIHHTSVRKVAFFIDICLRAIDSQDLNRYITDALRHFHFVGQAARRLAGKLVNTRTRKSTPLLLIR